MKPAPQKYRTTNWKTYNEALKARDSLLIWLDPVMKWHGRQSGKRGRSQTFSDEEIQFCLSIKCLFNLPLRQAMGMTQSLLHLAGLDWPAPDYSTVSRRQKTLQVAFGAVPTTTGLHLLGTARVSRCWAKASGGRKSMAQTIAANGARCISGSTRPRSRSGPWR
jgi:hypothetical protein